MLHRHSLLAVLLSALLAATPGAALAQNAGDEQYSDPFAPGTGQNDEPQAEQPVPPVGDGGDADQGEAVPAPVPAPAPAEAVADPTAEAAQAPSLPRTGLPVLLVAATGLVLLVAGGTLRRRA